MLKHDKGNTKKVRLQRISAACKTKLRAAIPAAIFACMMLTGCVKDELYNTPHPDKGVASVSVNIPQGMTDDYVIEVDGTPLPKGRTESDPLTPGEHTVLAYNTPEGFTVTDGIAYVERVNGARAPGDLIDPLPEVLYSGTKTITIAADDTLHVDLDVAQRTRDLRLQLTVTEGNPERIASITGTLSGVAGAYNLLGETLYGEAASTAPIFTRSGDMVTADLRLLGTAGDVQTLTLVLTFTNGLTQTVESDLTDVLASFNVGTEHTLTVTGTLRTPTEAGAGGCTITDWTHGGSGSGSAT